MHKPAQKSSKSLTDKLRTTTPKLCAYLASQPSTTDNGIGELDYDTDQLYKNTRGVYVITDGEYVKIGRTTSLRNRLKDLQVANARPLTLLAFIKGYQDTEQELHYRFGHARVRGEWFKLTPELQNIRTEYATRLHF